MLYTGRVRIEFQISCQRLNLCFRKIINQKMWVLWISARHLANSIHHSWGVGGGIIFQTLIVTCPTEFAAACSQSLMVCFCHESCQIMRQSVTETDRPLAEVLMNFKRGSWQLCLCRAVFDLLYSLLMAKLSVRVLNGLLPTGWPRVNTMSSSIPPVNSPEKFPRGVGIVCCSVQIETLQYFDLSFRNNNLISFS